MDKSEIKNRKTMVLLVGGLIGLVAGLATAYILIKKQEQTGQPIKLTTSDGLKLGMSTASLIKMASDIAIRPR